MRLDFALLGPLEVRVGGDELALDGPVQRRILAALLLRAGHSVSVPRLADAAWDDNQPSTARQQVQNRVSGLRRRLVRAGVADPIDTTHSGYRVKIDQDQLDVWAFDRLVAQASECAGGGDIAGAIRVVREALGLWRGPALAGLGGDLLSREAAALAERRLAAWEQCVQWELASNAHDRVVSELSLLVAEHPLRERLVGQYMLALYRAGRQADALTAYQDVARRLADDLGIDPGPELRQLYADILRNDPGLRPPGPEQPAVAAVAAGDAALAVPDRGARSPLIVPAQLPSDAPGFVGRDEHLRMLDKSLGDPDSGTAAVINTIGGPAGVGKTVLAVHWAHRARVEFPDGQLY
ncbi:MAG: hypothetical protein QOI74_1107, partial [Micromonosporaceae bacterium]|nr:hypothetical protein [Micromonosporaceae bacterium]